MSSSMSKARPEPSPHQAVMRSGNEKRNRQVQRSARHEGSCTSVVQVFSGAGEMRLDKKSAGWLHQLAERGRNK
jgi:hypothetical protein